MTNGKGSIADVCFSYCTTTSDRYYCHSYSMPTGWRIIGTKHFSSTVGNLMTNGIFHCWGLCQLRKTGVCVSYCTTTLLSFLLYYGLWPARLWGRNLRTMIDEDDSPTFVISREIWAGVERENSRTEDERWWVINGEKTVKCCFGETCRKTATSNINIMA